MVGYVKHHFFVRYRAFESLAHLNQLAEQWLATEADQRVHGTVGEVVAERFAREAGHLKPLPRWRFDTAYVDSRWVAWDGYLDMHGNRYSVPDAFRGQAMTVFLTLDGQLTVHDAQGRKVAEHRQRPAAEGWSTVAAHHETLWDRTLAVESRDLAVYEEVGQCN